MKETTNLIIENLYNLTSLWKTAGTSFNAYYKFSDFEYCNIANTEWPNRLWFDQPITQHIIDEIKEKLTSTTSAITLPIWNTVSSKENNLLEQNGFMLKFKQIGMGLKLSKLFEDNNDLKIKKVTTVEEAKLWSALFIKSFGYTISSETLIKTIKKVDYYIAYHAEIAVGTAVLYTTNKVVGVHSVGIPPEMRRRGYAEKIMKLLLNIAIKNGQKYATLQASNMGKNIYLKLGFEEQFEIKNFILKQSL